MITYAWSRPEETAERVAWHVNNSRGQEFTPDGEPYYVSDRARKEAVVAHAGVLVVSSHFTPETRQHLAHTAQLSCAAPEDPLSVAHAIKAVDDTFFPEDMFDIYDEKTDSLLPDNHPAWEAHDWAHKRREKFRLGVLETLKTHGRLINQARQRGKQHFPHDKKQQHYLGLGHIQGKRMPSTDSMDQMWEYLARGILVIPPRTESNMRLIVPMRRKGGKPDKEVGIHQTIEKLPNHTCAHCATHIAVHSLRVTYQYDKRGLVDARGNPLGKKHYSDHEHYHHSCFMEEKTSQLDFTRARFEPMPTHVLRSMHASRQKPRPEAIEPPAPPRELIIINNAPPTTDRAKGKLYTA
jgi:hypothetical protein